MTLRQPSELSSGPVYERMGAGSLRRLDPTEHNMERLNARARGACTTYCVAELDGPLLRRALEQALDSMTDRHPMLRVRMGMNDEGDLVFLPTRGSRPDGTAPVPIAFRRVSDAEQWAPLVEADMNAGSIDSARGPLFALCLLEEEGLEDGAAGRRALILIGHHAVSDGVSLLALLDELLQELAAPRAWTSLPDRPLQDPFQLDTPEDLGPFVTEVSRVLELSDPSLREAQSRELHAKLESIEESLLAMGSAESGYPAALRSVQEWIDRLASQVEHRVGVLAEEDLGTSAARYDRARSGLFRGGLTREETLAVREEARARGLTLHAALSAAMLHALAERHGLVATKSGLDCPQHAHLSLASPVNLRAQFVPPLDASDVRMAVDMAIAHVPVSRGDRFWDIAARAGSATRRSVERRRALSSWFRTARRSFDLSPPGVPLALISNVGAVPLQDNYGPIRVKDVSMAMTSHGSFQIGMLACTFQDRIRTCVYGEVPTTSLTSMRRFNETAIAALSDAASGNDPSIPWG